ncbi:MAG TPA: SRPBCC family protein [Candidatus Binatia bacterium]|nr:SRPBCC family protein [Candidatus Binatia bacterium]
MSQSAQSTFVYVIFIRTTPEKLWSALTDPAQMKEYWFGMHIESEWKKGAEWQMLFPDGRIGDTGEILEFDRPKRMRLKWRNEFRPELKAEGVSLCTMELEPVGATVRLTITHMIEYPDSKFIQAVSGGWPKILSNLKSLLETGQAVLTQADHSHAR